MQKDLKYWLALNEYPKFGPRAFMRFLDKFESIEAAFNASQSELEQVGIKSQAAAGFIEARKNIDPNKLHDEIEHNNVSVITLADDDYPPLLRQIYDPPALLRIKGTMPSSDIAHIAVVGSRKATPYGVQATESIVGELAEAGVVIVSGGAFGIDEAAHVAATRAGGLTVAVLASGFLTLSSRQISLARRIIAAAGAVVSEFPLRAPGQKQNFPFRNRIISGLSNGVLVVEAAEKSGSLITARSATEQNRDLFAVPGPITSATSTGTNNLLKIGAKVVTSAADILDELNIENICRLNTPKPQPDSKEEALILDLLTKEPIHIDEIARATNLNISKVASTLTLMEMKGRARHMGGRYYILA